MLHIRKLTIRLLRPLEIVSAYKYYIKNKIKLKLRLDFFIIALARVALRYYQFMTIWTLSVYSLLELLMPLVTTFIDVDIISWGFPDGRVCVYFFIELKIMDDDM